MLKGNWFIVCLNVKHFFSYGEQIFSRARLKVSWVNPLHSIKLITQHVANVIVYVTSLMLNFNASFSIHFRNDMKDLIWVCENLKTFKPKDFYKKIKHSHISQEKAEQRLRELLNLIKSEVNCIKVSYLINNFKVNKSITTSCRRRYSFTHLFVSSSIYSLTVLGADNWLRIVLAWLERFFQQGTIVFRMNQISLLKFDLIRIQFRLNSTFKNYYLRI